MIHSLGEVGEALAWLGCALQPHSASKPSNSSIVYCRPILTRIDAVGEALSRSSANSHNAISWNISFEARQGLASLEGSSSQCWFGLFKTAVVVEGYPILRRPKRNAGLEIPLNTITELTQATHATRFDGKLFIKGCRAMLVLVEALKNVMIWHLFLQENAGHSSYTDPRVSGMGVDYPTPSDVSSFRHVVGWCPDVRKCISELLRK